MHVYQVDSSTNITEAMYADDTGVTTVPNPITTDLDGKVEFYLDTEKRVDIKVDAIAGRIDARTWADQDVGPVLATDVATQVELDTHLNDALAAHAALAVSVTPTGGLAADDVQEALAALGSVAVPVGDYVVADGVADDTVGLQAAINAGGRRGTLNFPQGTIIRITAPVKLEDGLLGRPDNFGQVWNMNGCIIKADTTDQDFVLQLSAQQCHFNNGLFDANNKALVGVYSQNGRRSRFSSVTFTKAKIGTGSEANITNRSGTGVVAGTLTGRAGSNNYVNFDACLASVNASFGYSTGGLGDSNGWVFENLCGAENNGNSGFLILDSTTRLICPYAQGNFTDLGGGVIQGYGIQFGRTTPSVINTSFCEVIFPYIESQAVSTNPADGGGGIGFVAGNSNTAWLMNDIENAGRSVNRSVGTADLNIAMQNMNGVLRIHQGTSGIEIDGHTIRINDFPDADGSLALAPQGTGAVKLLSGALDHDGTTVGFNGATPVGKRTLGAAATDAATTQTLANNLRQALIDLGLGQT